MCDNMEDSADVCARRKLEFQCMPFKTKSFYVDVKSKAVRQRVEGYILNLGGSIETFLSNDIHVFVSDTRPVTKRPSRLRAETTLQHGDLSSAASKNNQPLPLSRGRALLMKARKNTSEILTSEVNNVSNIQDKAIEMGIKIEHVHSFLKRCKELGATSKQASRKDTLCDMVPIKWEDKCFLKVEDDSCQYKPLHKKLENIPVLYPENGGGSPFDGAVVLIRPAVESTIRKEKKVSRFSQTKGGYCEMCQAWYKDTLKQHAKSSGHQKFVRNKENFSELDKIVRKLPNLNKFLFKYLPTRTVNKVPCYKSDSTPVTSPDIQPSVKDVFDFDVPTGGKINSDSDITQVESRNSKLPTSSVCSLDLTLTNNVFTTAPNIDTSSVQTATTDAAFDGRAVQPPTPVFGFDNTDVFSGLLDHQVADIKMFSEASDVDSQTNVLKYLIDSLTLQNVTEVPSPMVVNTPDIQTQESKILCSSPKHTSQVNDDTIPGETPTGHQNADTILFPESTRAHVNADTTVVPAMPSGNLNTDAITVPELTEDAPMSTGSPIRVPMVTESVLSPGQLKLKFLLGAEPSPSHKVLKSKHRRKESNKCMYLSQKTSDTKLKLCKIVVTPVAQKSNLKMYWKVRKTGDCRLLFSSEKRKRSVPDENALGTGEPISPLRANDVIQKPKRQRLIF